VTSTPERLGTGFGPDADAYVKAQQSPEFQELRRRYRGFSFPMTAAFLAWYFLFVLLAVFAPDLMATPVIGNINVGILLGLGQFVSTALITWLYVRHANKTLDPMAEQIRTKLEGSAR
jgi:uncharacterized membrane protein (DUF485 family)